MYYNCCVSFQTVRKRIIFGEENIRKEKNNKYMYYIFTISLLPSLVFVSQFDCLFVCLGFSSHLRIFHSYGDITIDGEGLQILTYARHSWPLSSESSLACLRRPVSLESIAEHLAVELSLSLFTTQVCCGWDSNNQHSACKVNALTHCPTATVPYWVRSCDTK